MNMHASVSRIIHRTSVGAAAMGMVLSPIPLADEIVFVPVFAWLASRIGKEHGLPRSRVPWRPIAKTAFSGLAARAAINVTVAFVPGVAAVANAVSAAVLTELVGGFIDAACSDPEAARPLGIKEFAAQLTMRLRSRETVGV